MKKIRQVDKDKFLYPVHPYHGQSTADTLCFNQNFQKFAQKVAFIANLHTGGKLSSEEAYAQLESLWQQLNQTHTTIL